MVKAGRPKKPNGRLSMQPQIDAEYMDMLQEYRADERKKRRLQSTSPSPSPSVKTELKTELGQSSDDGHFEDVELTGKKDIGAAPLADALDTGVDSDSDSDFDNFEDVELDGAESGADLDGSEYPQHQEVTVSLDESQARNLVRKKREKGLPRSTRIGIHKIALIVWMVHTRIRSTWLNSREVRESVVLKNVFTHQVMRELYPPGHLTDFLKSKRLISGLKAALEEWKLKFRVVRPGLASVSAEKGDPAARHEYLDDLLALRGSTDLLCQGFCAVVRALGFRARLVCSLQPPDNLGGVVEPSIKETKSGSPLFWAEIWDQWAPGWISVDVLTSTVRMPIGNRPPTAIEPKSSDHLNVLRYCVAWERGRARDVTRRYATRFNARTRKKRLPHFESDEWLNRLFAYFGPTRYTRADLAEIRELAKYPRREGIPKRVQDFIGHPQYALRDQLHHNELLRPGAVPCGTLANKGKQQPVTYIYLRQDVLVAHSAQSWYRKGRSIKPGAQAVIRRSAKNRLTGETETIGLYTGDQTELYVPPPVDDDGVVPKSQYRTIDIFTDSMIPRGAVYIRDPLAVEAAKAMRIDYANAVTNIEFGKRGPQSKYLGVVVAEQYEPSMRLVLKGLREQQHEDFVRKEDARILALWRQYIIGIQIWDRVERMNPQFDKPTEDATNNGDSDSSTSDLSNDNREASENELSTQLTSPRRKAPQERRSKDPVNSVGTNTIRVDEFGRDISALENSPGAVPVSSRSAQSSTLQRDAYSRTDDEGSPQSHSSFSDLDVDEISESELLPS